MTFGDYLRRQLGPTCHQIIPRPELGRPTQNYPFGFSSGPARRRIQEDYLTAGVIIESRVNWHRNRKQKCHQPQP
jgi:hypothetical protein